MNMMSHWNRKKLRGLTPSVEPGVPNGNTPPKLGFAATRSTTPALIARVADFGILCSALYGRLQRSVEPTRVELRRTVVQGAE